MKIILSPVRMDAQLTLERAGDTLILNGTAVALSLVDDNDMDEPEQLHPFIAGPVQRDDDGWLITVLWPYSLSDFSEPPKPRTALLGDGENITLGS